MKAQNEIPKIQNEIPQFLNEKQVSQIVGLALPTLRGHRFRGEGIPYYKVGRACKYKLQDVLDFMESKKISFGARV